MQSVDLTVHLPERMRLPVPDSLVDRIHREEMVSWQFYPEDGVVGFLSFVVGDEAAVRAVWRQLDAVQRFDLTTLDDDAFYVYAEMAVAQATERLFGTFGDRGLVIVPPVVYTDLETVRFTALGDSRALSGLLEGFPDDITVDVERVSEHTGRLGTLAGRLTARQFEALDVARRLGYYDVPRTGRLQAVADELGCSESAASTILRRAEAALVDAALGR